MNAPSTARRARGATATALSAAAVCLAAACATAHAGTVGLPSQIGGAYAVPATSLREAKFRATVRQQYDFSCGSAAVATLLTHHYGLTVGEDQVFEAMYRSGDQAKIRVEGFSLLDMKRYLAGLGFEADGFQESIDKLAEAGVPAIVLVNEAGYNHFVVVKGLRDGRVLLGDPAGGTRALPRAAFERVWSNGVLFVIANRPEMARFNAAADWRTVPAAPLGGAVPRDGLGGVVMPKFGPGDF